LRTSFKEKMNIVHEKQAARSAALRARLIDVAEKLVSARGLPALRARDVAAGAGCALGTIYTVFADMDSLILLVNARTQEALGACLDEVAEPNSPAKQLRALAEAYLGYAARNRHRWDALFSHRMASGAKAPDWFMVEQAALFSRIEGPIAALCPAMPADAVRMAARTAFSAVHGIVALGLDQRLTPIDTRGLSEELQRFVDALSAGLPIGAAQADGKPG
jgi:AcrR family transcriptional regulator